MEYLNQSASAINGRVMFYAKETDIPEIYGKISRPDTPINESSKMTLDQMFDLVLVVHLVTMIHYYVQNQTKSESLSQRFLM
jgi:hypothetical protein